VENVSLLGFDEPLQVPPSRKAIICAESEWPESVKAMRPNVSPLAGVAVPIASFKIASPEELEELPWSRLVRTLEVEDVPTKSLPELSMRARSLPLVEMATWSAPGE
jgi:hypothetical protein